MLLAFYTPPLMMIWGIWAVCHYLIGVPDWVGLLLFGWACSATALVAIVLLLNANNRR
jgi:hypothetical protein